MYAVEVALHKNILAGDIVCRPDGAGASGNTVWVAEGNKSTGADKGDLGFAEIADGFGGNDIVARLDLKLGDVGLAGELHKKHIDGAVARGLFGKYFFSDAV
ncbi:hypothetical protein SDC9_172261 [bioreactor metagenome]|uniref:Uncharacterized protein n=1 Tax=bioreactor metagenome TaxID=1076179 RepID=A0A645GFC3_9ZZZZ